MNPAIDENLKKYELIQKIKNFIYDSKFKELKIFSKQYLSSILYSIYENNENSTFSLAFGDFDGLRAINDKHSIPIGDQAMMDSLNLIKQILPADTIIARAAGDEIVFLSTSLTMSAWNRLIKEIRDTMAKQKENLYGLNITISAYDSTVKTNFDDLYKISEWDVGSKKKKSHQHELLSKEEILNDKILNDFRKYFNYYRLNEGTTKSIPLPPSYFPTLEASLIDIVIKRFEHVATPLDLYIERLESSLANNETFLKYLSIPKESALIINDLVLSDNNSNNLENLNLQDLENVFHFLVKDPLTSEFSKNYFKNYLCTEISSAPEEKISVQMFDLVHLKLSNDTITHVKTDTKISELFNTIVTELRSKIDYSDFEHDSGNYLISYAGKLISIQKGDFTIPDDEINEMLQKSRKNQRILDIVTAKKDGKNSDLEDILTQLSDECSEQKHDLKINKITSNETSFSLNIALNDSISYFIDNFPDPYSLESKKQLIKNLWVGAFTVLEERYPKIPTKNIHKKSKDTNSDTDEQIHTL